MWLGRGHRLTWEDHIKLGRELRDAARTIRRVNKLIEKRMGSNHKTSRRSAKLEESISQLVSDLNEVLDKDFSHTNYPLERYDVYYDREDAPDNPGH